MSVSPDSSMLASCGNDKKVTVWSLPEGNKLRTLQLDGWVRRSRLYAYMLRGRHLWRIDSCLMH